MTTRLQWVETSKFKGQQCLVGLKFPLLEDHFFQGKNLRIFDITQFYESFLLPLPQKAEEFYQRMDG